MQVCESAAFICCLSCLGAIPDAEMSVLLRVGFGLHSCNSTYSLFFIRGLFNSGFNCADCLEFL